MQIVKSTRAVPALVRNFGTREGSDKYGLKSLQPGECIETNDFIDSAKAAAKLTSAVSAFKKRTNSPHKYSVRQYSVDGVQHVGVFCIAAEAAEAA